MDFIKAFVRSEEHTSELQSRRNLVCRLLLEKKIQSRRQLLAALHAIVTALGRVRAVTGVDL